LIRAAWLLIVVAVLCLLAGLADLEPATGVAYGCALVTSAALAALVLVRFAFRGGRRG